MVLASQYHVYRCKVTSRVFNRAGAPAPLDVTLQAPAGRAAADQWRSCRDWELKGTDVVAAAAGIDLWTLLSRANLQSLHIADASRTVLNPAVREVMTRVATGSGDEIASVWLLDDVTLRLGDPLDRQVLRLLASLLTQLPG